METVPYNEAKINSARLDAELGLKIDEIEKNITASPTGKNFWAGLKPDVLQTPYSEFYEIIHKLNLPPGSTFVDVGAAYGRLGYVIGKSFPSYNFIGFEAVQARVDEGAKVLKQFSNVQLIWADVIAAAFALPLAEVYFIYDFGSPQDVRKTLFDLGEVSKSKKIIVIGRGRLCRDLIEQENPWLSQVVTPAHFKNYSIYQTARV